ncbi:hybrid sensor histidine kinase/response regulator [Candidatus Venteria ishoeyi]|nr:ATP-binding protein [Candidatus Venteria ishoeyi]
MIISIVLILSSALVWQFRSTLLSLSDSSAEMMVQGRIEQVEHEGQVIINALAENLLNPLYNYNMQAIYELLTVAKQNDQVAYVQVYDATGSLVHNGDENIPDFGKAVAEPLLDSTPRDIQVTLSLDILELSLSMWMMDDPLGGVKLGLSLHKMQQEVLIIHEYMKEQGRQSLYRNLWTVIFSTLGLLLVGGGFVILIVRQLVQPIRQLMHYTDEIGRGHFTLDIKAERHDEIGDLLKAFEKMSKALQQQEKLRKEKEEAEQANRAKSTFLATMSHEIRTPMNGVLGMAELLMGTEQSKEQREFTATIARSGQALLSIINDILDFSKIEAGKLELEYIDFNLPELLKDALELFHERADSKQLTLEVLIQPGVPENLYGDPGRLRQIIINLVGNAFKFTEQGIIKIHVSHLKQGALHRMKALPERATWLHVEIQDTGIGIPESMQAKIFDSFSQADDATTRKYGGTGLGLAISRQLVELMHGRIGIRSQEGQGTTFWFDICLGQGKSQDTGLSLESEQHLSTADKQDDLRIKALSGLVLLAEDNRVNQLVAVNMLKKMHLHADIANHGLEVLQALAKQPYDLILMDCQMPEMDGFSATRAIRQQEQQSGRHIPIIALTANAMKGDQAICIAAGMDDYLSKPFTLDALYVLLKKYLAPADMRCSATSQTDMPPLNLEILAELKNLCAGKANIYQSLIKVYLHKSEESLAQLTTAIAHNDMASLPRIVDNWQKNNARFGAKTLMALCKQLSKLSEAQQARDLLPQIQQEFLRVQAVLQKETTNPIAEKPFNIT